MSETVKTLGTIIDADQQRDAIHVAVAPVICGAGELRPGMHVGFCEAGDHERVTAHPYDGVMVGIVDPFLTVAVQKGERFWLFLYPGSITSLRHDWTHPAFEPATKAHAVHQSDSEAWLRAAAERIDIGYHGLMRAAQEWVEYEEHTVQHNAESWRDSGIGNDPEFWHHYEVMTNTVVPEDRKRSFFCCTC